MISISISNHTKVKYPRGIAKSTFLKFKHDSVIVPTRLEKPLRRWRATHGACSDTSRTRVSHVHVHCDTLFNYRQRTIWLCKSAQPAVCITLEQGHVRASQRFVVHDELLAMEHITARVTLVPRYWRFGRQTIFKATMELLW